MKHSWLFWFLSGSTLGILISFGGLYIFERLFTDRMTVLSVKNIGDYTVRVHGQKSWDNWCFVQYIDTTNSTQNGALSSLPIDSFYTEHCSDTEKTPWIIIADSDKVPHPNFRLLTGVANGTTYREYTFSDTTGRYELAPER